MKKFDLTKWLGWIISFATILTWIFIAGQQSGRIKRIEETTKNNAQLIEKNNNLLFKQQELNGKIITYFEIKENEKN